MKWNRIEVYIHLLYWCLWCRQFYYIIEFLFVKMSELRWVLSTDHRDHSLLYEHELFSCSLKKIFDWTTTWQMTFLLCSRYSFFTKNKSNYISIWTKILIKCSVCCVCLYEWFVWDWILTRKVWSSLVFIRS